MNSVDMWYSLSPKNCFPVLINLYFDAERSNFRIPTISKTKYPSKVKLPELSQFEFEKLAIATNNFHLANKMGQGGFGLVYRVCFCLQLLVEILMCATVFSLAIQQKVIGH
ncbi:hypothetical protein HN51_069995 [Arachis hypogaea]